MVPTNMMSLNTKFEEMHSNTLLFNFHHTGKININNIKNIDSNYGVK